MQEKSTKQSKINQIKLLNAVMSLIHPTKKKAKKKPRRADLYFARAARVAKIAKIAERMVRGTRGGQLAGRFALRKSLKHTSDPFLPKCARGPNEATSLFASSPRSAAKARTVLIARSLSSTRSARVAFAMIAGVLMVFIVFLRLGYVLIVSHYEIDARGIEKINAN